MWEAVRQDWRALDYADDSLKRDRALVLAAVRCDWRALRYADISLASDREVVLAAWRQDRRALQHADQAGCSCWAAAMGGVAALAVNDDEASYVLLGSAGGMAK